MKTILSGQFFFPFKLKSAWIQLYGINQNQCIFTIVLKVFFKKCLTVLKIDFIVIMQNIIS